MDTPTSGLDSQTLAELEAALDAEDRARAQANQNPTQQEPFGFDFIPGQGRKRPLPGSFGVNQPQEKRRQIQSTAGPDTHFPDETSDGKPLAPVGEIENMINFLYLNGAPGKYSQIQPLEYIKNVKALSNPYFSQDSDGYNLYASSKNFILFMNDFFNGLNLIWYNGGNLLPDKINQFYTIIQEVIRQILAQVGGGRTQLFFTPALEDAGDRIIGIPPKKIIRNVPAAIPIPAAGRGGANAPAQNGPRGGGGARGRGGGGAGRGRGAAPPPLPQRNPGEAGPDVPILPSFRGFEKATDEEDPLQNLDDPCFQLLKNALFQGMIFSFF